MAASNRRDRGAATVQLVVITPFVLLLMLLCVQAALAWHAQHIAQTAAAQGLADARAAGGSADAGADAARGALRATAGRVLNAPQVQVTRNTTTASVRVRGTVLPVVPGLRLTVRGHADGPVERFTTLASDGGQR
jgi:Flp pilus assembly protein TadG